MTWSAGRWSRTRTRKRKSLDRSRSMMRVLTAGVLVSVVSASLIAQEPTRPKIGETVTTASGLIYKFTKQGSGPKPETGDLMVIHGIGTLPDGKEFWNTRTEIG